MVKGLSADVIHSVTVFLDQEDDVDQSAAAALRRGGSVVDPGGDLEAKWAASMAAAAAGKAVRSADPPQSVPPFPQGSMQRNTAAARVHPETSLPAGLAAVPAAAAPSHMPALPPFLGRDALVDRDPCVCVGAPCPGSDGVGCGCGARAARAGCCVVGRAPYAEALAYLYGPLSLDEALWALTGAPLTCLAVFCLPAINFATIPLFWARNGLAQGGEEGGQGLRRPPRAAPA